MRYTHIRNATALIAYPEATLLVDPFFMTAGAGASYSGSGVRTPTVPLPSTPESIVAKADAVLLTHLHEDHFDAAARAHVPKDMPILTTLPLVSELRLLGFTTVTPIEPGMTWRGVSMLPVRAQHGPEHVLYRMGHVTGYVLRAVGEPSLYLMSDTILVDHVRDAIRREAPDVLVMSAGGAFSRGTDGPIIMDDAQVIEAMALAPRARGIAVHLEATDHCRVTRASLRSAVAGRDDISTRLLIPADGETLVLSAT